MDNEQSFNNNSEIQDNISNNEDINNDINNIDFGIEGNTNSNIEVDNNNNNNNSNTNSNSNSNNNDNQEENYSFDEDEDFPQYANRINKKLNSIIKKYKSEIKHTQSEIDENEGMVKILSDHIKSVETQVKNKQMILDYTKEQIKLEEHIKQTTNRQIGKLNSQIKTLEDQEVDLQERLNTIQHNIYKANEKLDKYKIEMKFKQDELEQYAMAARQKEDDNLNIEKYKRQDELKIKELMLMIEKYTIEVNRKHIELEKEVTETQASQIEMEKTTEELKQLQLDRQGLLEKLSLTEKQIKKRNNELAEEATKFFDNKMQVINLKKVLDDKINQLNTNTRKNKELEEKHKKDDNNLIRLRDTLLKNEKDLKEINNEIEIKKNELSAISKELMKKTNLVNHLNSELEIRKKKLDESKSGYNTKKKNLNDNQAIFESAKAREARSQAEYNALESQLKLSRQDLEKNVNILYDKSKKLFESREKEANMIGEINNIISAKKNITANIYKLNQEITKQKELIYNVDFQIQLMERKVAWVQGKRSQEETKEITKEIEILKTSKEEKTSKLKSLQSSLKEIEEELRSVESTLKANQEEHSKLVTIIEELELENIKSSQNLNKITKKKEEILVQHDLMKLEIKKLYDKLVKEANQVFTEENKLFQLELSIKEREKEAQVHKDILVSEHKRAEVERHKTATELSQKLIIANNLKLKYESTKKKSSVGEGLENDENSQAWQVIKTAQDKEELQRQKDENDGKIEKCTNNLKSLYKTIDSLKERNERLKKNKLEKKSGKVDMSIKQELDEKLYNASDELNSYKTELKKLDKLIEDEKLNYKEKTAKTDIILNKINYLKSEENSISEAINKKIDQLNRAKMKYKKTKDNLMAKKKDIDLNEDSNIEYECKIAEEKERNKYLLNAISLLCNENSSLREAIINPLQDKGIVIPIKALSEKSDSISMVSGNTNRSQNSNFNTDYNK